MSLHKSYPLVNIPFSWENQPGISKITPHAEESAAQEHARLPLPPPPCQSDSPKLSAHGIYVPLPPCAFQPPPRQVLTRKEEGEDPFVAAYRECTRSRKHGTAAMERKRDVWAVLERFGLGLSCRSSSGVREGVVLRLKEQKSVLANSKGKNYIF